MINLTPNHHGSNEPSSRGMDQLLEARSRLDKNESYERRSDLVRQAVNRQFGTTNGYGYDSNGYAYPETVFDDTVVFRKDGRLFKVSYSVSDGDVEFGDDLSEVTDAYVPV